MQMSFNKSFLYKSMLSSFCKLIKVDVYNIVVDCIVLEVDLSLSFMFEQSFHNRKENLNYSLGFHSKNIVQLLFSKCLSYQNRWRVKAKVLHQCLQVLSIEKSIFKMNYFYNFSDSFQIISNINNEMMLKDRSSGTKLTN